MNFEIQWLVDMHGKTPKGLQTYCDGCGNLFDTNHALNCKNGVVYQRHNELQNENCDLMKKAGFNQVICEPIVKEAKAEDNGLGELRGDWSVRGFWIIQKVAVFGTRIFNSKALLTNPYLWKLLSISTEMRKRTCIMMLWNTQILLQSLLHVKVFLIVKLKHI